MSCHTSPCGLFSGITVPDPYHVLGEYAWWRLAHEQCMLMEPELRTHIFSSRFRIQENNITEATDTKALTVNVPNSTELSSTMKLALVSWLNVTEGVTLKATTCVYNLKPLGL